MENRKWYDCSLQNFLSQLLNPGGSVTLLRTTYPFYPLIAKVKHLLVWDLWSVYCYNVILVASLHNGPSDSHLLVFTLLSNPLPHRTELICVTSRILQKWWCITFKIKAKLLSSLLSTLYLSYHLLCGKPHPEQSYGEAYRGGTEVSTQQPYEWAWNQIFQPQSSFQGLQPQPDCSLMSSLSQTQPAKPGSWPLETMWDNKCLF